MGTFSVRSLLVFHFYTWVVRLIILFNFCYLPILSFLVSEYLVNGQYFHHFMVWSCHDFGERVGHDPHHHCQIHSIYNKTYVVGFSYFRGMEWLSQVYVITAYLHWCLKAYLTRMSLTLVTYIWATNHTPNILLRIMQLCCDIGCWLYTFILHQKVLFPDCFM